MRIIYYKRDNGSIRFFQLITSNVTEEDVQKYNESMGGRETAHIVEYEDVSFEAHIFMKAMLADAAKDSLEELLDSAQNLAIKASYVLDSLE